MDDSAGEPLVAVIIPVHATPPQFLREAIESVRRQTETRWELVIVLDAAAESPSTVALEMAALDPARIAVAGEVGGTPRGASTARNRGVARSRAPMLGFLDADDVLEPEWIRSRLALLEAHPAVAMVYGPSRYWYSWTGAESDRTRDFVPDPGIETGVVHPPPTLVASLLDGTAAVPVPCSILVRRWAFDAIGGFDETSRELYEDQALYASLALRFPLLADDRVLDWYRQHPESMTARVSHPDSIRARWHYLDWLEREMAAAGIDDHAIRRAIDRERWKIRHPALARVLRVSQRAAKRLLSVVRRSAGL